MSDQSWKIAESATDWECGWEDSERFHLRRFRALSITEKLMAIEEMADLAEFLGRRARERRRATGDR